MAQVKQETGEVIEVRSLMVLDESQRHLERIQDASEFPGCILDLIIPRRGEKFTLVEVIEKRKVVLSSISGGPSNLRQRQALNDSHPTYKPLQRVEWKGRGRFDFISLEGLEL